MAQKILRLWKNTEKPLRKWEGVSLGRKNVGSRNPHMWKYTMMKRKWRNEMKRTKRNIKGTSNFRSLSQKP